MFFDVFSKMGSCRGPSFRKEVKKSDFLTFFDVFLRKFFLLKKKRWKTQKVKKMTKKHVFFAKKHEKGTFWGPAPACQVKRCKKPEKGQKTPFFEQKKLGRNLYPRQFPVGEKTCKNDENDENRVFFVRFLWEAKKGLQGGLGAPFNCSKNDKKFKKGSLSALPCLWENRPFKKVTVFLQNGRFVNKRKKWKKRKKRKKLTNLRKSEKMTKKCAF